MMNLEIFEWDSVILGLLATCLFAECIVLIVRVNSLKNKMESEAESIKNDELLKFQKKSNELDMLYKERELELKCEYEDMLSTARVAKREQEEKLSEAKVALQNANMAIDKAQNQYAKYISLKETYKINLDEYAMKLANLSNLDYDSIKKEAKLQIAKKCDLDLTVYKEELLEKSKQSIDEQAKAILLNAMQRISTKVVQEVSATIVKIPEEAIKGRLIGKEGRNIRSFESCTQTTLVIDETPDSVMISSFSPRKRRIAKLALEALIADGRINPSNIESAVEEAKEKIKDEFYTEGSNAIESLGLARVNSELVELLGALSVHTSLNQDSLLHSIETASLCANIANELNCDASLAKRAGLFHDIGKAIEDSNFSHAKTAGIYLRKYGENEYVVNAVEAHHGEVTPTNIYATILQIADSLSATRPGARMEATDSYIQRIKTLENIALSHEGVMSAYALQAGREIRVIVSPEQVNDVQASEIARDIRKKIEQAINNTIPVKIIIIREQRFSEITNAEID